MTFLEHLNELRARVLRSVAAVAGLSLFAFMFRWEWTAYGPVTLPVRFATNDPLAGQILARAKMDLLPTDVQLVAAGPTDAMFALFCAAGIFGLVLGMPFVIYQFARFVGPALRAREKRIAVWSVLPASLLFLIGCAFSYLLLLPFTYSFLFGYATPIADQKWVTIGDFMQFTVLFSVAFGFAFELPVIMGIISGAGIVAPATWRKHWTWAAVAIFVFGAVITPDGTGVTMILVAIPMLALYGTGCGVAAVVGRRRAEAAEREERTAAPG